MDYSVNTAKGYWYITFGRWFYPWWLTIDVQCNMEEQGNINCSESLFSFAGIQLHLAWNMKQQSLAVNWKMLNFCLTKKQWHEANQGNRYLEPCSCKRANCRLFTHKVSDWYALIGWQKAKNIVDNSHLSQIKVCSTVYTKNPVINPKLVLQIALCDVGLIEEWKTSFFLTSLN